MTRDAILKTLQAHRGQLAAFAVRRLALFGSFARGEETAESDVDLLVSFEGEATFDRYFDLKFWLEDLLGRSVDLVTEKSLRNEIAPEVRREAIHVTP